MVFLQSACSPAAPARRLGPAVLACLAVMSVSPATAEPAAPATSIVTTGAPFAAVAQQMVAQQFVAEQLAADRQFVAEALLQQQQKLEEIMAQNEAMMMQPPTEMPTESLFASRIADFAEVQTGIVTDYSDLLRLRTTGVADGVDDRTAALSLLFAQTGFVFGAPNVVIVSPAPLPAPTLPSPTVPFPGFPVAVGGFFAAQGQ